jgi:hypothetical protein
MMERIRKKMQSVLVSAALAIGMAAPAAAGSTDPQASSTGYPASLMFPR